jgi:hypothetical protein
LFSSDATIHGCGSWVGHEYLGFNHQYLAALLRNLNVFYTLPIWQSGVNILGLMPLAVAQPSQAARQAKGCPVAPGPTPPDDRQSSHPTHPIMSQSSCLASPWFDAPQCPHGSMHEICVNIHDKRYNMHKYIKNAFNYMYKDARNMHKYALGKCTLICTNIHEYAKERQKLYESICKA